MTRHHLAAQADRWPARQRLTTLHAKACRRLAARRPLPDLRILGQRPSCPLAGGRAGPVRVHV